MASRRLSPQETAAFLERACKDLSTAEIAALAGTERLQTVSDWRTQGLPADTAELILHRLLARRARAAAAFAAETANLARLMGQFRLGE